MYLRHQQILIKAGKVGLETAVWGIGADLLGILSAESNS
jgi:hypothetical protein